MSDFLDRLVQQSLVGRTNLRPRLMPIFERASVEAIPDVLRATRHEEASSQIVERIRTEAGDSTPAVEPPPFREPTTTSPVEQALIREVPATHLETTHQVNETIRTERETHLVKERHAVERVHTESALTLVSQALPERPRSNVAASLPLTLPPSLLPPTPEPKAVTASLPDVEIHIGRVEVRAQFAAAPRRETTVRKGPGLTLDKYLEDRR